MSQSTPIGIYAWIHKQEIGLMQSSLDITSSTECRVGLYANCRYSQGIWFIWPDLI